MPKKLSFSPAAIEELREIGRYVAKDNLNAALALVDRIKQRCQDAADYPTAGRNRDVLRPGLRSVTEGNYIIFYRPVGESVEIMKIVYGARDIEKLFK